MEGYEQYLLPPPRSEYPIFRIENERIEFPILEEPVWVEGLRVGVDVRITEHCPDVRYHSGPCRDGVSSVHVVLSDSVCDANGERRIPPEQFLHQSVDIR